MKRLFSLFLILVMLFNSLLAFPCNVHAEEGDTDTGITDETQYVEENLDEEDLSDETLLEEDQDTEEDVIPSQVTSETENETTEDNIDNETAGDSEDTEDETETEEGLIIPDKEDAEIEDESLEEIDDELVTCDLSEYIIQEGGFPEDLSGETDSINSGETTSLISGFNACEKAIYNALESMKGSLNVSSYHLTEAQLKTSAFKVINESPELFYVQSKIAWNTSGSYVSTVYFYYYSGSNMEASVQALNSVVDSIISSVDPDWSDLQKAMYLNDALAVRCDYDFTYSRYNAYNALVQGSAVCQGYALAYQLLAKKAGLECHMVTSKGLNHAWNIISIDGIYYYTDPTWNDGPNIQHRYNYFLCSRDELYEKRHGTKDWLVNSLNVYNKIETSDKYRDYFWKNDRNYIDKGIVYYGNQAVYLEYVEEGYNFDYYIVFYDLTNESIAKRITPAGDKYKYTSYFSAVLDLDGSIYYNSQDSIYRLDPITGQQELVYTLTPEEQAVGYIYYMFMQYYKIGYGLTDKSVMDSVPEQMNIMDADTVAKQDYISGDLVIATNNTGLITALSNDSSHIDIIPTGSDDVFEIHSFENTELDYENHTCKLYQYSSSDYAAIIPYETLKTLHVPSGDATVQISCDDGPFISPTIDLNACASAPAVSIVQQGSQLVISSADTTFLNGLTEAGILNHVDGTARDGGTIVINSDGRTGTLGNQRLITSAYDTSSQDLVFNGNTVTISADTLVENSIFNGSDATADLLVYGYEKASVSIPSGISIACEPGLADYTICQDSNGDIVIESANTAWLSALARPAVYNGENEVFSFRDYGRITGSMSFTSGGRQIPFNAQVSNSHYDNRDELNYSYENGRIVIPSETLSRIKFADGDYQLTLHAPGFEDNVVSNFHITTPIQAYVPADLSLNYDASAGLRIISSDTAWMSALKNGMIRISSRSNGTFEIETSIRGVLENNTLIVSPGHLSGAGIVSGAYDVMLVPEGYVNYGYRSRGIYIGNDVKKIFVVSFHNEDGTLIEKKTVNQGSKVKAPDGLSKRGYHFVGWYTDGKKCDLSKVVKSNLELTAIWDENTYKLAYNVNGGKGTVEKTLTHKLNDPVTVSELSPYRNGYDFLGWSRNKSDTEPEFRAGDSLTGINIDLANGATITLYAVYSDPLPYDLALDPRGGSLAPKQAYDARLEWNDLTERYETIFDITSPTIKVPALVKEGYKFNGWYDLNGEKKVTSIAKGLYGNRTLYADFTPVVYKLTYTLNKGTIAKGDIYDKTFTIETSSVTLPVPNRTGYTFDGWYADKIFSVPVGGREDLTLHNTTLYAKWSPITYTVRFNKGNDSATGSMDDMVYTYDAAMKLTDNQFVLRGFAFDGWTYVNEKGKTVTVKNVASIKNISYQQDETIKFTAKWKAVSAYSIKYVLNKGTQEKGFSVPTKYASDTTETYLLPLPTRKGYIFDGWYKDYAFRYPVSTKDAEGRQKIDSSSYGNITLYAKWTPITYTVTFHSDEAGDAQSLVATYDVSYTLDNDMFKVPGELVSKFTYSYTDAKGKLVTKTIAGNAKIKNLADTQDAIIEMSVAKAKDGTELWKTVTYTIKYSLPKGAKNGAKNPTKYTYSPIPIYKINNPTLKGSVFQYWMYTDKDDQLQYIYPEAGGDSYLPAGLYQDLVLIPVFNAE